MPKIERVPTTEEEIKNAYVGDAPVLNSTITLHDYDPEWPRLYRREAERVRAALGERVLRLEHVGSTSVPGLCAKPRIDIVLVVRDSSDEPSYRPVLEAAGYRLTIREPQWNEHRCFTDSDPDVNLHVYSEGTPEIDRYLTFRNHLRRSESDRELYARTKRELAKRTWKYTQNYADAKNAVVDEIIARASVDA